MPKNKQRLMLFFFIVIYVGIAIVGFGIAYYVKTTFFPFTQGSQQPTNQTTKALSPTPTGWKTYTNADFNLKFSYPSTDTVSTKQYGFGVSSAAFNNKNGILDVQILFLPKSLASAVGQDFDSYYAIPNNTTKVIKSPLSQDNTTEKFTKIHDRMINGNQALDYQSIPSNTQPHTQPEIGTFIDVGNNLVLISTAQNNKEELEQLLGTFRYLQN
jgi:hypothetical protein